MPSVGGVGDSGYVPGADDETLKRIQEAKSGAPSIADYWGYMLGVTDETLHNLFAIRQLDAAYYIRSGRNAISGVDYWLNLLEQMGIQMEDFPKVNPILLAYNIENAAEGQNEVDVNNPRIEDFANKWDAYMAFANTFNALVDSGDVNGPKLFTQIWFPRQQDGSPYLLEDLPEFTVEGGETAAELNAMINQYNPVLENNQDTMLTYTNYILDLNYMVDMANTAYNANEAALSSRGLQRPQSAEHLYPYTTFGIPLNYSTDWLALQQLLAPELIIMDAVDTSSPLDLATYNYNSNNYDTAINENNANTSDMANFFTTTNEYNELATAFNNDLAAINSQRASEGLPALSALPIVEMPHTGSYTWGNLELPSDYPVIDWSTYMDSEDLEASELVATLNEEIDTFNDVMIANAPIVDDHNVVIDEFNAANSELESNWDYLINTYGWTPPNAYDPTGQTHGHYTHSASELYHHLTWFGYNAGSSLASQALGYDLTTVTPTNADINNVNAYITGDWNTLYNYIDANLTDINNILTNTGEDTLPVPPTIASLTEIESVGPSAAEMDQYRIDFATQFPDEDPNDFTDAEILERLNVYDSTSLTNQIASNYQIVSDNNATVADINAFLEAYNAAVPTLDADGTLPGPGGSFTTVPTLNPLAGVPTGLLPEPPDWTHTAAGEELSYLNQGSLVSVNSMTDAEEAALDDRADAAFRAMKRILRQSPGREAAEKQREFRPAATAAMTQILRLGAADASLVFSHAQNMDLARIVTLTVLNQAPEVQNSPLPANIVSLIEGSFIAILDQLNPKANVDAIALAGSILGPNVSLDDIALIFFTALSQLEQTIGILSTTAIDDLIATILEAQTNLFQLPQEIREEIAKILKGAIALPLLRVAITQIAVVLGDIKPIEQIMISLYEAREKEPDKPLDELVKPFEGALASQLAAAVAEQFGGRLTGKQQEALTQRIITQLLGPTLLTLRPAIGPTEEEKQIVREEVTGPEARRKAEADDRAERKASVLPSAVQLFFDNFNLVHEHAKYINRRIATKIEENFREAPVMRLTENLSDWFVRKLLPVFQFEHTPGGITYRSDDKDPNLPPPDVLFRG